MLTPTSRPRPSSLPTAIPDITILKTNLDNRVDKELESTLASQVMDWVKLQTRSMFNASEYHIERI